MPEREGHIYQMTWSCERNDDSREKAELPWFLKEAHVGPILVQVSTLHQVTRKLHTRKCMLQKGPLLSLLTHWGSTLHFFLGAIGQSQEEPDAPLRCSLVYRTPPM
jgi:hypothetical protein